MRHLFLLGDAQAERDLGRHFRPRGVAVDFVETMEDAESAIATVKFDALAIDFAKARVREETNVRSLRDASPKTVLVCFNGDSSSDERVAFLNRGIDAFIRNDVTGPELDASLQALVRLATSRQAEEVLECGNLRLDPSTLDVWVGERALTIPRRELSMLLFMMRRRGRVISKAAAEEGLYEFGQEVSSNSIEVSVCRLRKALKTAQATVQIRTLRGVGYTFSEK